MWPTINLSLAPEAAENVARLQHHAGPGAILGGSSTQPSGTQSGTQASQEGVSRGPPSVLRGSQEILARRVVRWEKGSQWKPE